MSDNQSTAPVEVSPESSEVSEVQSQEVSSENVTEAQIDADPSLTAAEKKEAKRMLKSLKIKVDGSELEENLPFEIPDDPKAIEYMKRQLQMAKVGSKRAQEAAELRNYMNEAFSNLKNNPKLISELGVDLKEFAASIINEEIERSQLSPEELRIRELEETLAAMKEEKEREAKEIQEREFERLREQEFERYDSMISQAIEKSDLPKSPYVIKKMADYMLLGLQNGLDVAPTDVISLVRDEIHNDIKEMFGAMPDEVLEQLIDKQTYDRMRKRNLSKSKEAPPVPLSKAIKDVVKPTDMDQKPKDKKSYKEFFKL